MARRFPRSPYGRRAALVLALGEAACSAGGTDGAVAAGSGGTGGGSDAGAPTFGTQFGDLNDWTQRNGRGAGATIGIGPHSSAEDGSVLALLFPGAPGLGPMDFQGPASAVEVESVATFHYGRYETSVRFAS